MEGDYVVERTELAANKKKPRLPKGNALRVDADDGLAEVRVKFEALLAHKSDKDDALRRLAED